MRGRTGNKPVQGVRRATEGDGAGAGGRTSDDRLQTAWRCDDVTLEVDRQPGSFR
jgi:hypothetical protein